MKQTLCSDVTKAKTSVTIVAGCEVCYSSLESCVMVSGHGLLGALLTHCYTGCALGSTLIPYILYSGPKDYHSICLIAINLSV